VGKVSATKQHTSAISFPFKAFAPEKLYFEKVQLTPLEIIQTSLSRSRSPSQHTAPRSQQPVQRSQAES